MVESRKELLKKRIELFFVTSNQAASELQIICVQLLARSLCCSVELESTLGKIIRDLPKQVRVAEQRYYLGCRALRDGERQIVGDEPPLKRVKIGLPLGIEEQNLVVHRRKPALVFLDQFRLKAT